MKGLFFLSFVLACVSGFAVTDLVRHGTLDGDPKEVLKEFRCSNNGAASGRYELFTEDLSWNKCIKLIAGSVHDEMGGGRMRRVSSAYLYVGGTETRGFAVEPNMYYTFSFDLKGTPKQAIVRIFELWDENGREVRRSAQKDLYFEPGRASWRRFSIKHRTGEKARRVELCVLLWSLQNEGCDLFHPNDFLLVDNVSFVRSERYARMMEILKSGREPFRVAPFAVESNPSCPFMPIELADAPAEIAFHAAVNEKKPLPIAIGNMTDSFAQYRVVLETEPRAIPGTAFISDNGSFGLDGFPSEKISVREALRFKDDEQASATRYDPLVEMNAASVLSVPAHDAGAVWFDFDTTDVDPGTYRGRLRIIPLNIGSDYGVEKGRYVRKRSGEKFIPVTLTVDPIVLSRESVRPAHLCSPCMSEQSFALECDIGARIYYVNTHLFRPEAVGNPQSPVRRVLADYQRWAKNRGVTLTYFVKYDAYNAAQGIFNPRRDAAKNWEAWEQYVRTLATIMQEAGVAFENYYVLVRDEPIDSELPIIREAHHRMKALYPKMQTYLSICERKGFGSTDYLADLGDSTDLWTMTSPMYGVDKTRAGLQALKAKYGAKLLHYICHTSFTESLAGYFRRHCWIGERWGLDADMIYHFTNWRHGQYGELSFKMVPLGELSYNIGGRFFPSVRYMAYREGVTDIKYVQALRDKRGNEPEVKKFLEASAVSASTGDLDVMVRVREQIRQMLLNP